MSEHNSYQLFYSFRMRLIATINIVVQLLFPLMMAFSPVMVARANSVQSNLASLPSAASATQSYRLSAGETAASVAEKFNMNVQALHFLNMHTTFPNGFDGIKAGDTILVPAASLKQFTIDSEPSGGEGRVAGMAVTTGNLLTGDQDAESMLRGAATGRANAEIQQWMDQFGKARISLSPDEKMNLKNSQADLLFPLLENDRSMLFMQSSLHRTDDRSQTNLGLGGRYFSPDYMLGMNLFFDHDLSRKHSRIGVGAEYWRDNLRFSANTYQRLSGWRVSPDFDDYFERPANGWDIRAEGWLPAWPYLGVNLSYEQYYGQEVALFGKDNLQRNPHAITTGLSYTPFPLVTFKSDLRQGKGGENDVQVGLSLNYQFGTPFSLQISPGSVSELRSLGGSRYDFVDRNNNIILEYQKETVMQLSTPEMISGFSGEVIPVDAVIATKHGLDRIEWSSPELIQNGGKIMSEGNSHRILLPTYQMERSLNTYVLHGVAIDVKGNRSSQQETQVLVDVPDYDAEQSSFTPASVELFSDGKSNQEFTLTVLDNAGTAVDMHIEDVSISLTSDKDSPSATLSAVTQKETGIFTVSLTSGIVEETLKVTPSLRNSPLEGAEVKIQDPLRSSIIVVNPTQVKANGYSEAEIALTATDTDGNPVSGLDVSFDAGNDKGVKIGSVSEKNGVYIATISGQLPGEVTIKPMVEGRYVSSLNVLFTLAPLDASDIDTGKTKVEALPAAIKANGNHGSRLALTVKDEHDNLVTGLDVNDITFELTGSTGAATLGAIVSKTSEESDKKGVYAATLTGTAVGDVTVTPKINGAKGDIATATVSLLPLDGNDIHAEVNDFTAGAFAIADGVDKSTLEFFAKDIHSNPITGLTVSFNVELKGKAAVINATEDAQANGVYRAELTSTIAGSAVVSPLVDGQSVNINREVIFTAGAVDANRSGISASPDILPADGEVKTKITFTARDIFDNPVTGIENNITFHADFDGAILDGKVGVENNELGVYFVTMTATKTGTVNIHPKVNNVDIGVNVAVTLIPARTNQGKSEFSIGHSEILSDGSTTLKFIAHDKQGNLVLDADVTFSVKDATGPAVVIEPVNHNGAGVYTAELKGTGPAGTVTIIPVVDTIRYEKGIELVLLPGSVSGMSGLLPTTGNLIVSDSLNPIKQELTFSAIDIYNNKVVNLGGDLTFASNNSNVQIENDNIRENNGVYTVDVYSSVIGQADIVPMYKGVQIGTSAKSSLTFTPAAVSDSSTIEISTNKMAAGEVAELTFKAFDAFGNAVTDLKNVNFKPTDNNGQVITDAKIAGIAEDANSPGTYKATLTATKTNTITVVPVVGGIEINKNVGLTVTAGKASDKSNISIVEQNVTIDDAKITVRFKALDQFDNPVINLGNVIFALTEGVAQTGATIGIVSESPLNSGVYDASLTVIRPGQITIVPEVNQERVDKVSVSLTVNGGVVNAAQSTIAIDKSAMTVDEKARLTFTALDKNDNPVIGLSDVAFILDDQDNTGATVTNLTQSNGVYTATLNAERPGSISVKAAGGGVATNNSVTLTLSVGKVDAGQSEFARNDSNSSVMTVDDTATLTFTARDQFRNLLTGLSSQVTFAIANNSVGAVVGGINETQAGRYTATLNAGSPGAVTIEAQVDSYAAASTVSLTINGGKVDADVSTIAIDKTTMSVDEEAKLTFTAFDQRDNPVLGLTDVVFNLNSGETKAAVTDVTSVGDGTYTAILKAQKPGEVTVTATGGEVTTANSIKLTLSVGKINATESAFVRSDSSGSSVMTADDTATLTFTARDQFKNLLTGMPVVFEATNNPTETGGVVSNVKETASGSGIYTATLEAAKPGTVTIVPKVGANTVAVTAIELTVNGGEVNAAQSTIAIDKSAMTVDEKAQLTFTAFDQKDNPVIGLNDVEFILDDQGNTGATVSNLTESNGVYTATLNAERPGSISVKATGGGVATNNSVTLTLSVGQVDAGQSEFDIDSSVMTVDEEVTLRFTARDQFNNLLTGLNKETSYIDFDITGGQLTGAKIDTVSEDPLNNGHYTAVLTAIRPGIVTIEPKAGANTVAGKAIGLTINVGRIDTTKSSIHSALDSVSIDQTTAITFTALDQFDNRIVGLKNLALIADGNTGATIGTTAEDEQNPGNYIAQLDATSATALGTVTIVPQLGGDRIGLSKELNIVGGKVNALESKIQISTSQTAIPNDVNEMTVDEQATVVFTARDAKGNHVSGQNVEFDVTGAKVGAVTEETKDGKGTGVYKAELLETTLAGTVTIISKVNNEEVGAKELKLIAGAMDAAQSSIRVINKDATAITEMTVDDEPTLEFTARDKHGNNVKGITVGFSSDFNEAVIAENTSENDGVYTTTIASKRAGLTTIAPWINNDNNPVAGKTVSLTIKPGAIHEKYSLIKATPDTYTASTANIIVDLSFEPKDQYGNPVVIASARSFAFGIENATSPLLSVVTGTGSYIVYKLTLRNQRAADVIKVVPYVDSIAVPGISLDIVGKSASANIAQSIIELSDNEIAITDTATVTLKLFDSLGNAVKDKVVVFEREGINHTIGDVIEQNPGEYSATITASNIAGDIVITAGIEDEPAFNKKITLSVKNKTVSRIEVQNPGKVTPDNPSIHLIIKAFDEDDNLLKGEKLTLSFVSAANRAGTPTVEGTHRAAARFNGLQMPGSLIINTGEQGVTDLEVSNIYMNDWVSEIGFGSLVNYVVRDVNNVVSEDFSITYYSHYSPDSPLALNYGAMPEEFNGFKKPALIGEYTSNGGSRTIGGERWLELGAHGATINVPANCTPPSPEEGVALVNAGAFIYMWPYSNKPNGSGLALNKILTRDLNGNLSGLTMSGAVSTRGNTMLICKA